MRLIPLLLILALVLAACGSSSNDNGGGGGSSTAKAIVASAQKAKVGRVVVDAQGRTLYRFTAEAQGRPVCTGACASTWLPAIVGSASGLPAHVATVKRDDGKLQLTYDGHPLYRYAGDTSTADANGQGVGGQWFVVKPSGTSNGSDSSGTTTSGTSKRGYVLIYCKLYRMQAIKPGPLIRGLREQAGLSQRRLAGRMGTTQSAIAALERDDSNPTWRTVADALDALGHQPVLKAAPKPDGVDESLIREQLERTPAQRLRTLESMARQARALTLAGTRARGGLG
jgi:predicted lipoprotein with Yx(FWY)xxD motif/transcriptional regulator with XRE-family HTH domain